jgi:hypothetical protein
VTSRIWIRITVLRIHNTDFEEIKQLYCNTSNVKSPQKNLSNEVIQNLSNGALTPSVGILTAASLGHSDGLYWSLLGLSYT